MKIPAMVFRRSGANARLAAMRAAGSPACAWTGRIGKWVDAPIIRRKSSVLTALKIPIAWIARVGIMRPKIAYHVIAIS
jgi:hypothetical protein